MRDEQRQPLRAVARALLEIKAVVFTPDDPLTFKSGIKSPVYVDNRRLPFWPEQWRIVVEATQAYIAAAQPEYDIIAGIAAGGVPHSSALAYQLGMPSVFVRKEAKEHGKGRRVEGPVTPGDRVVVVEDVITTGGSALAAIEQARAFGLQVIGALAIIDRLEGGAEAFNQIGVPLKTLLTIRDFGIGSSG